MPEYYTTEDFTKPIECLTMALESIQCLYEPYREYAKQWLIQFAVNAGFVKNKKEVVDDYEV